MELQSSFWNGIVPKTGPADCRPGNGVSQMDVPEAGLFESGDEPAGML
jgi:hypothetical protein